MTAPYRSRMNRDALENGPDETEWVTCPECQGSCVRPATKFAPFSDRPCELCGGEGEVDPSVVEIEP